MKTGQLVELLARDDTRRASPGRSLLLALLPAGLVAAVAFVLLVGFRPDLAGAFHSTRFSFKVLLNASLWLAATGLLLRLVRPGASSRGWRSGLWAVPVVLALAVVMELLVVPRSQWWTVAWGSNATWCLRVIPALAVLPLLATLLALRSSAPGHPAMAGAAAGLMSAGLAGTLYALHCPDDSPLFVGLWYVLASAIVTATGALLGARWLRW
ncbi:MAG TPA: DUF1109 domain-containing protein [Steroidobacteraceae bacterium]|nr:DUF1109 domain-containing protein [Steroidobacteraceae bacterium]